jgi:hypothetical protein
MNTIQQCKNLQNLKSFHLVHTLNKMPQHETKHYYFKIWYMLKNDLSLITQWLLLKKHYLVVEGV